MTAKDAATGTSPRLSRPHDSTPSNRGVTGWIRKHMSVRRDYHARAAQAQHPQEADGEGAGELPDVEVGDVFESSEYTMTDYEMESTGDLA
jgi:hypothetical protein